MTTETWTVGPSQTPEAIGWNYQAISSLGRKGRWLYAYEADAQQAADALNEGKEFLNGEPLLYVPNW
jgi:hypothetical protein